MVKDEVAAKITEVLHAQLDAIGFERAEILEEEDHDGDPILRIVLYYGKVEPAIDVSPTFSLARHVKDAIRPLGEDRFPHFRHRFPAGLEFKAA